MLTSYEKQGIISRKERIILALMNSFPTVVMHWKYLLPIYIPLLGLTGLIYFLILVIVGFLKTSLIMLFGRHTFPPCEQLTFLLDLNQ